MFPYVRQNAGMIGIQWECTYWDINERLMRYSWLLSRLSNVAMENGPCMDDVTSDLPKKKRVIKNPMKTTVTGVIIAVASCG